MVLLGAAWDKERARELLGTKGHPLFYVALTNAQCAFVVGPSAYTIFYVGAICNDPKSDVEVGGTQSA